MNLKKHVLGILLAIAVPVCAYAQNVTVKGQVKDDAGEPLALVSIAEQGTSNGTVTDLDGNYSISVPSNATLQFSFMGYTTVTEQVNGRTTINVTLSEDAELLDEIVVIGYGVQKKSDLTGAVASVRAEALKNISTTDAAAALQGKVSGINVLTNGAPGQGAQLRVRGYSTNATRSEEVSPLYIVDGLQVSSIQYLDPSMIESMEILKDAASAAIYGAQAGNGVVLITTKSGSEGQATITYSGKATHQSYPKNPMMNREEFLKYKRMELGDNKVATDLGNFDYSHPMYANGVIDTDWMDAYMEPTWSQQHSLSVSGGNKQGHYFTSINMVNNNGVVKGDKDVYKRLTAQINADYNIKKWFQVGSNMSIEKWSTASVSQQSYTSSFEQMLTMDPLTPVYWTDVNQMPNDFKSRYDKVMAGDPNTPVYRFLGDENGWFANTLYEESEGTALAKRDIPEQSTNGGFNINGTLFANLMPINGLTITTRLGYRISQSVSHSYQSPYYVGGRGSSDNYSISATANTGYYYQWENFANYNFSVGSNNFGIMAGMSYREDNSDNVGGNASAAPGVDLLPSYNENFLFLSKVLAGATKGISNLPSKSASLAYFGRLTYNYDNRYNFQANFRADAFDASKLPEYNRWGYFPSFSAGWTISNESFFRDNLDASTFSFLKIRASWGQNGNVAVLRDYPYAATISIGNSWYQYGVDQLGTTYGSAPSGLPNSNLRWETSEQLDLGLDARFLDNRLTLGIDYFNKQTKDLLFSVSVPPELGVSSTMANGGNVLNSGLEFELGWRDRIGGFSYSVDANFSTLHNEVLALAEGAAPQYKTDASSTNYEIRTAFEVGYPIWYLNGYVYEGVAEEDIYWTNPADNSQVLMFKKGDAILQDKNNDGQIGTDDMQYIGQGTPKFTYGVNINLAWKGFDFTVQGSGIGGNSILPVITRPGYRNTFKYFLENSRSEDNPNGTLPNPANVTGDYKYWSSTANLFKGDFFRFKQIQLGYTIPNKITKKAAISDLRFYASLDDFFTITSYPGLDPETASTNNTTGVGLDWGSYPTMKKFILGVNLTF